MLGLPFVFFLFYCSGTFLPCTTLWCVFTRLLIVNRKKSPTPAGLFWRFSAQILEPKKYIIQLLFFFYCANESVEPVWPITGRNSCRTSESITRRMKEKKIGYEIHRFMSKGETDGHCWIIEYNSHCRFPFFYDCTVC